jgi:hypothetical protein
VVRHGLRGRKVVLKTVFHGPGIVPRPVR